MKKITVTTLSVIITFTSPLAQAKTGQFNTSIILDKCNTFINAGASPAIASALKTKEEREEYCKQHLKKHYVTQSRKKKPLVQ